MNLQETIIQLNELKLRGMSSSFEAMTSLPVQNRPSLEVAISKMVDAEVQDRRDRKTAMYLKISKLRPQFGIKKIGLEFGSLQYYSYLCSCKSISYEQ